MHYVYFIFQNNIPNQCKIGYTGDCLSRCCGLQTGNPNPLVVYRHIETNCPKKLEKYIHSQLKIFHINGEWYMITKELVDHVIESINVEELELKQKPKIPKMEKTQKMDHKNTNDKQKPLNPKHYCDICKTQFASYKNYWKHKKRKNLCLSREQYQKLIKENQDKNDENKKLKRLILQMVILKQN